MINEIKEYIKTKSVKEVPTCIGVQLINLKTYLESNLNGKIENKLTVNNIVFNRILISSIKYGLYYGKVQKFEIYNFYNQFKSNLYNKTLLIITGILRNITIESSFYREKCIKDTDKIFRGKFRNGIMLEIIRRENS